MYVCAAIYPMSLPLSLELSEDSVRSLMRVVFFHVPTEARNDATLPASVESFFFHPFSKRSGELLRAHKFIDSYCMS